MALKVSAVCTPVPLSQTRVEPGARNSSWRTLVEQQHAIEVDRERALAGIDVDMHAGAVAVLRLPGGNAERIPDAAKREIAVAADRAGERAHVAGKRDVAQLQRAAA